MNNIIHRYTPGPWHYQQVGTPGYFVIKGPGFNSLPQTVHNARLISASPDMLRVLHMCHSAFSFMADGERPAYSCSEMCREIETVFNAALGKLGYPGEPA